MQSRITSTLICNTGQQNVHCVATSNQGRQLGPNIPSKSATALNISQKGVMPTPA